MSESSVHLLELDDYEVANLQAGLAFLNHIGGNTGDWHGQIVHKLLQFDVQTVPNKSVHDQRRDLALSIGWRLFDA